MSRPRLVSSTLAVGAAIGALAAGAAGFLAAGSTGAAAALLGAAGLLGAAYAVFAYVLVARPLARLTAEGLGSGARAARVASPAVAELERLAALIEELSSTAERRVAERKALLDTAGEGLLLADPEGRVVAANAAMERIWRSFGLPAGGTIWERVAALAQHTGRAEHYAEVFARAAADPELVFEDEFELPDRKRSFVGRTAPVRSGEGALLGRTFSLRETTAERESERLKDEFVATVSHELRTPLTSIRGFVELLREGEGGGLTPDQRRFLAVVDRNAGRLQQLVDDLLLIAQLDTHTLRLRLDDVDLGEVALHAVEAARPAASEAGVALELYLEDVPVIRADRARLAQLADNLVSNALKFTPRGGRVEVSTFAERGKVALVVRDTGRGLSHDERAHVFERFYRTGQATERQVPGTGLGLAISKAIAEAHGGSLGVESAAGEGATFTLELPAEL